jgi:hypothetical protein
VLGSIQNSSPKTVARVAGVLLIVLVLTALFAQIYLSGSLIVPRDAAATARNFIENKGLVQLAFSVFLVEMVCQILHTALYYKLLRPARPTTALAAAFIDLAAGIMKTFSRLFLILPLFILGGSPSMTGFSTEQQQSLAMFSLEVNEQGPAIALAFFGISGLLNGYLVLRSTFLPRWLGVLCMLGAAGWLTFFYPPLGYRLLPVIALIAFVGLIARIVWFLVYGVDEERWKECASNMPAI